MNTEKIIKPVFASLFAALICVLILVVHIPLPGGLGYLNIGDSLCLTAGVLLGPVFGAAAAAVGGGLSDLILGYAVYVPGTAVIKALSAVIAYFLYRYVRAKRGVKTALACAAGELPQAFLYFLYEYFVLSYRAGAAANIPFNLLQGAVSAVLAVLIVTALKKTGLTEKYFPG